MSNIKQAPFLGLIGLGGGGTGLTSGGAVTKKTWVDDFFDIYLRKSTGAVATVNNAMDLSGDGGLVWTKSRSNAFWNVLYDTSRGGAYSLTSNNYNAQANNVSGAVTFNNNGYSIAAGYAENNASGYTYADWVFKKQQGFFDIVEWVGDDSGSRQISHNLGCTPGLIILKNRSRDGTNWMVWHRDFSATEFLEFNATSQKSSDSTLFGGSSSISPTDTNFTIGGGESANKLNDGFVAYLFAGGQSNASEARSVDFDGSTDALQLASNADLSPGTSDFTFECWLRPDAWGSSWETIYHNGVYDGFYVGKDSSQNFVVRASSNTSFIQQSSLPPIGQWTHIAVTRSGSTLRLFYNGVLKNSVSNSHNFSTAATGIAATAPSSGEAYDGEISNLRFVKGTALYTSTFRVPTEPLTNITNTKLLCCNNSSVTGSTVTPGTITANNSPTASTDSPFDDLGGYIFGDDGEQNVVKCGKFTGNTSADFKVDVGWEPQYIMFKSLQSSNNWSVFDSLRGIITGENENYLYPNLQNAEYNAERIALTPTGFIVSSGAGVLINENDKEYAFMAIRRKDGYVGKPPSAGNEVFTQDIGSGSSGIPSWDSNFVVDMAMNTQPASTQEKWIGARLTGTGAMRTNEKDAAFSSANWTWDSNSGWNKGSAGSDWQSWMWQRRGQSFDVVTYTGDEIAGRQVPHSLNKTVEMLWVKFRNDSKDWRVYHKGLNGGTTPAQYALKLNENEQNYTGAGYWNNTAPTATHFTLGDNSNVNEDAGTYIAMLFSSVDGISKCGFYDGSNSTITITTGFQPRYIIIKRTDSGGSWLTWDTLRGWVSGNNNPSLALNTNAAQTTGNNYTGGPTSTGFTLNTNADYNGSGGKYIYYAHS